MDKLPRIFMNYQCEQWIINEMYELSKRCTNHERDGKMNKKMIGSLGYNDYNMDHQIRVILREASKNILRTQYFIWFQYITWYGCKYGLSLNSKK